MKRALAGVIAALVALGVGGAAIHRDHRRHVVARGTPTRPAATVPGTVAVVPAPGQAVIQGGLTSLQADNANGAPLATPMTITIPNRGQGGADVSGVTIAGKDSAISWYGGQPLPLSGGAGIDLAGAPVVVDAGGITWTLDGAPRAIQPGHYFFGAPVAVGSSGLATPHDSISFDAGPQATIETRGRAMVHLALAPIHLEGPGQLTLHGSFDVRTAAGPRRATTIQFGPGSYSVDIKPGPGGLTIDAILQGRVTFA